MRYFIVTYIIVILITVSIMGTRGDFSKNTPLEVFPDMDRQAKFKTQTFNEFFPDSMADRLPVVGTSSRGSANNLNNVFSSSPEF